MKCSDLLRQLTKAGWKLSRQGKGSHIILEHPDRPGIAIPFPNHGSQEMGKGLTERIKKQAGL